MRAVARLSTGGHTQEVADMFGATGHMAEAFLLGGFTRAFLADQNGEAMHYLAYVWDPLFVNFPLPVICT